ncbi:MAG TPA: hypothetical protein VIZ43_00525 [Trebonia sp.]
MADVARRSGLSVQRVQLGWLRERAPNMVPLVGASRPGTIRDSARLIDMSPRDLEALDHDEAVTQRRP